MKMEENQARLNITYGGQNGDLPDPISTDATDADILAWAKEAVATGGVPGIPADANVDFTDYVVARHEPTEARDHHLINLRPKTPFGAACDVPGCDEGCYVGPVCKRHFSEFQASGFPGDVQAWIKSKG